MLSKVYKCNYYFFLLLLLINALDSRAKITGLPSFKAINIPFDENGNHYDLAIDDNNTIYIASSRGVKIFNGLNWELVEIGENSNIRRLYYNENRVYVGGEGLIGYIEKNDYGQYNYTDITPEASFGSFESVWQILKCDNSIYFQDIYDVMSFDLGSETTIKWHFNAKLGSMVCQNKKIMLQNRNIGLVELKNNKWQKNNIYLEKNDLIYSLTPIAGDEIFILSDNEEWRIIKNNQVELLAYSKDLPHIINYVSVASLGNNSKFVLGSNNGLLTFVNSKSNHFETFQLTNEWISKIIYRHQQLIVLTEFQVFYIEWPSPFRFDSKDSGISSNIHYMREWDDEFYVLSSSGVFLADQQQHIYQHKLFKKLNWTNREAWSLLPISKNHAVLAESHKLYLVDKLKKQPTTQISEVIYPRELYPSQYNPNLFFVITEYDLQTLIRKKNTWELHKIHTKRPQSILETNEGKIILSFDKDKPIQINFDPNSGIKLNNKSLTIKIDDNTDKHKSLLFLKNNLDTILAFSNTVYTFDNLEFKKSDLFGLSKTLGKEKLLSIKQGKNLNYYGHTATKIIISNKEKSWQTINLLPYLKNIISGVQQVGDDIKISSHGQIITYTPGIKKTKKKGINYKLAFNSVVYSNQNKETYLPISPTQPFVYSQGEGSINFVYSLNDIINTDANQYRYRLNGYDDKWSNYFSDNQISFNKLPAGKFSLELQAKSIENKVYSSLPYKFNVVPKWYFSTIAKLIWLLLSLFTLYFIFRKILEWRDTIYEEQKNELKKIIDKKTIALKSANDELKIIAHQDGLTGLSNRLYLDEYMKNIVKNNVQKIIVIMMDMDFFKTYNDKFGHVAGDDLLKLLSKHLKITFSKKGNIIARYGGEEFVIIMINSNLDEAQELSEKLRKLIENKDKQISISVGISTSNEDNRIDTIDDIYRVLNQADKALYQAKESGRNKIIVY